ncbi:MAG: trehalase family glycosidase [Elusimicrobiota bacterium]
MVKQENSSIWALVGDEFDEKVPRRTAVVVKPSIDGVSYAYPANFGQIGYYFDCRSNSTYEEDWLFSLTLAGVAYPMHNNATGDASIIQSYFVKMLYLPSAVVREVRFSSFGADATEILSQPYEDAMSWHIGFKSKRKEQFLDKKMYFDLYCRKGFKSASLISSGKLKVEFEAGDVVYLNTTARFIGTYASAEEYTAAIAGQKFNNKVIGSGKPAHLLFEYQVHLLLGQSQTLRVGLSQKSMALAQKACVCKDTLAVVEQRWNKWFTSLPRPEFTSAELEKVYYKCWWIVKLNYYKNPRWGHTVLEALPVYRGYWLWALSAVDFLSNQNSEYTSKYVKTVLELFTKYQREDGFISHAIYLTEKIPGENWGRRSITQTPHIPWVALRYYYATKDIKSLARWYPHLVKFYDYLTESRDKAFRNLHLWAIYTSYDTGLDTTAVFERVTYGENGVKEKYCYPAIYAAERFRYENALAKIAGILGKNGDADLYLAEADKTRGAIDKYLWDNKKKWYGVIHEDGKLDTRVGVDGLFPLAYGMVSKEKAKSAYPNYLKLIDTYGVRTVAEDEPGFMANVYWRGPSWPKSKSMAMAAAKNYYPQDVKRVLESIKNFVLKYPSVWECFNAKTGEVAYGDRGMMATPVICSNVGSAELMIAVMTALGTDMYSIDDEIVTRQSLRNFHWAGKRLDIAYDKRSGSVKVRGKAVEVKNRGDVTINGKKYRV